MDLVFGTEYTVEMVFDGEFAIQSFAGVEVAREPLDKIMKEAGRALLPILVVASDVDFRVHRIVVEGVESSSLPTHACEAWIQARMAEIFGG